MPIHAIGLISGGLDSILALRLMLDQGLGVEAMHVVLPVHGSMSCAWRTSSSPSCATPSTATELG
jgi:diphthamide synthase (EF-2-diphthine--ammonia ligase)